MRSREKQVSTYISVYLVPGIRNQSNCIRRNQLNCIRRLTYFSFNSRTEKNRLMNISIILTAYNYLNRGQSFQCFPLSETNPLKTNAVPARAILSDRLRLPVHFIPYPIIFKTVFDLSMIDHETDIEVVCKNPRVHRVWVLMMLLGWFMNAHWIHYVSTSRATLRFDLYSNSDRNSPWHVL